MDKKDLPHNNLANTLELAIEETKNLRYIWNSRTNSYDILHLKTGALIRAGEKFELSSMNGTAYTPIVGDIVCEAIRSGMTLQQLHGDMRFPPLSAIYFWKNNIPEFADKYAKATRDRAEYFHDEAIKAAMQITSKDEVPVARLKVETLKWAAEVSDPERFKPKIESAGVKGGVTVIIETGVPSKRLPDVLVEVDEHGEFKGIIQPEGQSNVSNGQGDRNLSTVPRNGGGREEVEEASFREPKPSTSSSDYRQFSDIGWGADESRRSHEGEFTQEGVTDEGKEKRDAGNDQKDRFKETPSDGL
jgi:hypothetical protein